MSDESVEEDDFFCVKVGSSLVPSFPCGEGRHRTETGAVGRNRRDGTGGTEGGTVSGFPGSLESVEGSGEKEYCRFTVEELDEEVD